MQKTRVQAKWFKQITDSTMYLTVEKGVNKAPGLGSVPLLSNTEGTSGGQKESKWSSLVLYTWLLRVRACVPSHFSRVWLFVTPCSPPGSSVRGILQVGLLEWVDSPFSRASSQPRNQTPSLTSLASAGGFFTTSTTWETLNMLTDLLVNRLRISQSTVCF